MNEIKKTAQTSVPINSILSDRWSPRAYGEKLIDDEDLVALFEAARWAPSSGNVQPWRFIVAKKGEAHFKKLASGLMEGNRVWAEKAPVLVATLARKTRTASDGSEKPNPHAWHDLGLAVGNLVAQATSMNLMVHQMGGILPNTIAENFKVNTNEFDIVSAFSIGYFDEHKIAELNERQAIAEKAPRTRKNLSDLVFSSNYGDQPDWL